MSETEDEQEAVGSVADEAMKLLGALSGWAKEHGDGFGALSDELHAHLSTDAPECTWCPVCRVVAAVRETSPEVRSHLTSAATSLAAAVSGMLSTQPPRDTGVERIDLDDEWPEGPE
ncbi:MAG TPA: hypothetical protein VHW64_08295 [Nocardioides sp.]|uniref:hypothetical protein n=1 Tax=Nocardioides sp. TaxID=35761 RepID=UPI002E37D35D|nr:hypothetical protein [Nocardioides sp.]HEX3930689.1 hypothetical protein [Nocardioides sp.]